MGGFSMTARAMAGNIYACDPAGTVCDMLTESIAADMQLDLRDAEHPYLLLPQIGMPTSQVRRFEVPMVTSGAPAPAPISVILTMTLTVEDPAAFVGNPDSAPAVEADIKTPEVEIQQMD